jgi:F-type H+-transporting ATPase subunit alpha
MDNGTRARLVDLICGKSLNGSVDGSDQGNVVAVGGGVAKVIGLPGVMAGEVLEFFTDVPGREMIGESDLCRVCVGRGVVFNLIEDVIGVVLLSGQRVIVQGGVVKRTGRLLDVPVGEGFVGRVVDGLLEPIDGKPAVSYAKRRLVEAQAPALMARGAVCEPFKTGILAIDALVPIGRGQRELVIGDRQTGKTSIVVDALLHQRDQGVVCVYVAVGQKASSVAVVCALMEQNRAFDYSVVVVSSADAVVAMQYIAPFAGAALAEYFMYRGLAALVVYDDLTKQAVAYRQLSLLLRRPPGREAYPGDVFYLHSRLLERAAKLVEGLGGGSITALPVVETQAGDVSGYIPTNVISITDGQVYLCSKLFNLGVLPAVDVGLSVSRVGAAAQTAAMRKVAGKLRLELVQYRELEKFVKFSSEVDPVAQRLLVKGRSICSLLVQGRYVAEDRFRRCDVMQVYLLCAGVEGCLSGCESRTCLDRFLDCSLPLVIKSGVAAWIAAGMPGAEKLSAAIENSILELYSNGVSRDLKLVDTEFTEAREFLRECLLEYPILSQIFGPSFKDVKGYLFLKTFAASEAEPCPPLGSLVRDFLGVLARQTELTMRGRLIDCIDRGRATAGF